MFSGDPPITNVSFFADQEKTSELTSATALIAHPKATSVATEYIYMLSWAKEPPVKTAIRP